MAIRHQETGAHAEDERGGKNPPEGHGPGDPCRCKETAQMTPRELLKLMMEDLAFWKKGKKG